MKAYFFNREGAIPIAVIVTLAIVALIGTGAIGFMLGRGIQGLVLTIAFTVVGIILLLNGVSVVKWAKELRREVKN